MEEVREEMRGKKERNKREPERTVIGRMGW